MLIDAHHIQLSLSDRPILRGVNLHLDEGEVYGLLGPNGAGKSTTVHVLLGLYTRDSGTVSVLGQDPDLGSSATRKEIGVLPEHAGFYGWMTPFEYLEWYSCLFGGVRFPVTELLDRAGLADAAERRIREFSRGMRQRLGIARALAHGPKLLILDEPTNGLDPRGRREIHDLLSRMAREQHVGILLCTHLMDDVERLCDKAGIITRGQTVLEGALTEVLARKGGGRLYRVRLESGEPPENAFLPSGVRVKWLPSGWCSVHIDADAPVSPSRLWKFLLETGWKIVEIQETGGGIKELYLRLTAGPEKTQENES